MTGPTVLDELPRRVTRRRAGIGRPYRPPVSEHVRVELGHLLSGEHGFDPRGDYVYLLFEHGGARPIYVGMTGNLLARLGQHLTDPTRATRVARVEVIRCLDREDAQQCELALIREHRPELNGTLSRL